MAQEWIRPLWRFAGRYLRNTEDAEDAVQETLLRVLRALPTFREGSPFDPWIWRIAANVCADFFRRRKPSASLDDVDLIAPTAADQDDHEILITAVSKLPERYRQVLELRYGAELSVEETAATLGLPVGTVKTNLFRAREILRRTLKNNET